ncbi:MAG: DUF1097 domain-containing protein [Kiritimatiellaeota bacterium]|nr:DUF1097 domain-containing protein [Kiritimatiellota bacterium]
MPFSKFIIIPLFIAFQAFSMMLIAPFIPFTALPVGGSGLITWISFQAWAMYFLAGCNIKMGLKVLVGYLGGIIASIAIFELAGVFSKLNGATTPWGLYLAVFVVVVFVISAQRVPGIDFVPSYFIGAGVFFALMTYQPKPAELCQYTWYMKLILPEMVACVVGLCFGWITVVFQTWYEARVKAAAA